MTVDAHVHLWRLSRGDNIALTPAMSTIYRDREPADLRPLISAAGVDRVVVVQAAETLAETLFTIGLARKNPWIAGVVGWVELASPSVEEEVDALAANPIVKGVRPVRDDNRTIAWMLDARLEPGFEALQRSAFSLDILVQNWREISLATTVARRWPGLSVVLDHCGKPDIAKKGFGPWARLVEDMAALPNVVCKLSGLMNCAGPGAGAEDVAIYIKHSVEAFGSSRIMWASDWPPLELASEYPMWKRICDLELQSLSETQRSEVFEKTAARVYRFQ